MAAYAALTSVMHILEQIQNHPHPPITIDKQQMESLCEIISSLQDFLENYSHRDRGGCLETQISDAAYAAEDIIESHIVDQILTEDGEKTTNNIFYQDLQKLIEDMNLIKKEATKIQEKVRGIDYDRLPRNIISMSANIIGSSTVPPPKRKNTNTMVGFDDILIQIMDKLTGCPTNRQVLPIVGMGGIGKTTLARNVYDHQYIVERFDVRVWVTISQEYRHGDILLEALSCLEPNYQRDENKREQELEERIYKCFYGRKYLVVLDDMWSIDAWEELMLLFPDNENGSRIMITTRILNVFNHFGSCGFKMNFLDEEKSWELLYKTVFTRDQCCPLELEETGKRIAMNCCGLPISISVIGGLLGKSERTLEYWEYIAENLSSIIISEENENCFKILALSYNHLPIHLKPCFLYMGVYPEDSKIRVSQLIKLWVGEGFLKPIKGKTLEMAARDYLNQLIDRNLILVHKFGSIGTVKYCKIHDLFRDLCLREAQKDEFLWARTVHDLDNLEGLQTLRRVSIHECRSKEEYDIDRVLEALPLSLVRSLRWDFKGTLSSNSFRLLREFNMVVGQEKYFTVQDEFKCSIKDIIKLVNSRYLAFRVSRNAKYILSSSIHLLWNLQTLIIDGKVINLINDKSPEFWKMSQLRHVEFKYKGVLHPPTVPIIQEGYDDCILKNLHTLKGILNFKLSEEVNKRIPNIRKLQIHYKDFNEGYCLNNLGRLNKIESLKFSSSAVETERSCWIEIIQNLAFLHSLKKLTLHGTYLLWEDMRVIGSLPHLQVLKLEMDSFKGPEWNPVEGEFLCLKVLCIDMCSDLVYWNASRTHFPCLEQLVFNFLDNLEEIPLDIGQISTLQSIELWHCSHSSIKSAKDLLDEQVELGNEDLHVRVFCWQDREHELEGLGTHNFKVQIFHDW